MKKAIGNLSVHIFVDCPHCQEQLDLFDDCDAGCVNEEGELWRVIEKHRTRGGWENLEMEVECQKCNKLFFFDELEY